MAILESRVKTGVSWVKESWDLFKQSPQKWLMLAIAYVGIYMMLPSFPGFQFFALVTILTWPIFIAMASRMYKNADTNPLEDISAIMKLIQPKLKTLMLLGIACLLYGIVVNYLLSADMQALEGYAQRAEALNEAEMEQFIQKMLPLMLKLSLFLAPLLMATWFSPMLIAFNDYSLIKAIKSSLAGSLQYIIAMSVAWLLLTAGIVTLMLVAGITVGIVGALVPMLARLLMPMVVFGCLLLASALMLAFQYVSYRDVFRSVL